MAHYALGPVKPHVKAISQDVGHRFDVRTIYGFANRDIAGTNTLSDHAKGLAADFMTYGDMAKGQKVANYFVANAATLNVKYIIWNREIWRPGRGWYKYTGLSPHTDHIHVSFTTDGTVPDMPGATPTATVNPKGLATLTSSATWIRVALFIGGLALIFVALTGATAKPIGRMINA